MLIFSGNINFSNISLSVREDTSITIKCIYRVQIKMPVILCAADQNNCAGMQGEKKSHLLFDRTKDVTQ